MKLLPASSEQEIIIKNITKRNILVDAVAGSGKTTTNLHIASTYSSYSILLLTYNKNLKLDSRKKVLNLGLKNIEVHSYHSFCVKYYDKMAFEDSIIIKIIREKTTPLIKYNYDIIILDEVQDLNKLYYELICKVVNNNENDAHICVLGDKNQCINKWNHSDFRYITFAEKLFEYNELDWLSCNLSKSFRITTQIANFLNKCMLSSSRIISDKIGSTVRYIICDSFKKESRIFKEVIYYLNKGYTYKDFFILAPSLKNGAKYNSPIRQFANSLSDNGIPIYVPSSDKEGLDKRELEGKIVFSTFHQAKGRERPIVIVFNFDESYFKYYSKDRNPSICPNELYVAVTRASEHLTVIHHYQNDYLPFLNKQILSDIVNLIIDTSIQYKNTFKPKSLDTAVTELTKYLPSNILSKCLTYINITKIQDKTTFIDIPRKTRQNYLIENVSEITGVAIPAYFEYIMTKNISIYIQSLCYNKTSSWDFIDDSDEEDFVPNNMYLEDINLENIKPSELLFIANKWNSYKTGYHFKLNQIIDYNWLSKKHLDSCIIRLTTHISKHSKYEVKYQISKEPELYNRRLIGFIDCIDNNNIWELKCVKTIRKEHYLQLAIYMYMHKIVQHWNKSIPKDELVEKSIKNIDIGDEIRFKFAIFTCIGKITQIHQNNLIDVMVGDRSYRITNDKILENISYIHRISNTNNEITYKYYLFNVLSNVIYELHATLEDLKELMNYLIQYKFYNVEHISDSDFLTHNTTILSKYFT